MALDKNNTTPGYLLGRIAATLTRFGELPPRPAGEMFENPMIQFPKHLRETQMGEEGKARLAEIMDMLPDGYLFPRVLPKEDASAYWIGYYQQEAEHDRVERRREIGLEVRRAREKAGLTVEQLAEKCDTPAHHIRRIEEGKYNLTIDTLGTLSKALGRKFEV